MATKNVLPIKVLDAVTSTGAGSSFDLETLANQFGIQVVVTGSPSSVDVALQGSMDGTNWYSLISRSAPNSGAEGTNASPQVAARYVRGYLSGLNGGTSPTVTLWAGAL